MNPLSLVRVEYHDSKRFLALYEVQESDATAVQEWLDRHLRGDYLFKKGHLLSIIKRPCAKMYAILLDGMYVGTIVFYSGSILHNIMIDPDYRGTGIGESCIRHLNPQVIRAKTNMIAGDPVPFYQRLGYTPTGVDPDRRHIVIMEQKQAEAPVFVATAVEQSRPVQPQPTAPSLPSGSSVLLPPPEFGSVEACARKWIEHKQRQKRRQVERTKKQHELDAQYAARYDPSAQRITLNGAMPNGHELHSSEGH